MAKPVKPTIPDFKPTPSDQCRVIVADNENPEIIPLPALLLNDAEGTVLTRWQLSGPEILRLLITGEIYLWLQCFGRPIPPSLITVYRPDVEDVSAPGDKPSRLPVQGNPNTRSFTGEDVIYPIPANVVADIHAERRSQIFKFGENEKHSSLMWLAILAEEFGEAAKNVREGAEWWILRQELVELAAVATAWLEAGDKAEAELDTLVNQEIEPLSTEEIIKAGEEELVLEQPEPIQYKLPPCEIQGFARQWVKCKECGNLASLDYQPNSLSSPVYVLPCGHFPFKEMAQYLTDEEALPLYVERYGVFEDHEKAEPQSDQ